MQHHQNLMHISYKSFNFFILWNLIASDTNQRRAMQKCHLSDLHFTGRPKIGLFFHVTRTLVSDGKVCFLICLFFEGNGLRHCDHCDVWVVGGDVIGIVSVRKLEGLNRQVLETACALLALVCLLLD